MKSLLGFLLVALTMSFQAQAGFDAYSSPTQHLGVMAGVKCSTGLTCTQNKGYMTVVSSPTITGTSLSLSSTLAVTGLSSLNGGVKFPAAGAALMTRFHGWIGSSLTGGTSVAASSSTLYLTQIYIPYSTTLTGITVSNAATTGSQKWIVALFDSAGAPQANSALAGTLSGTANVYQAIPFTAPKAVVGPGVYWIGLYADGADTFFAVPAVGASHGLAGSITGQTFGTVAGANVLPTTFTADKGPVAFTY